MVIQSVARSKKGPILQLSRASCGVAGPDAGRIKRDDSDIVCAGVGAAFGCQGKRSRGRWCGNNGGGGDGTGAFVVVARSGAFVVGAVPSLLAVLEEETEIMPLPKPTAVPEAEGVLGVGAPAVQRTDMGAKSMHSDNWRC